MNENTSEQPKLSLGKPPGSLGGKFKGVSHRWFWLLVALQVAILVLVLTPAGDRRWPQDSLAPDLDQLKTLAQNLEEQNLDAQAAKAWQDYLQAAPNEPDRAEILYRAGKLYMQAEEFDEAAAALVQAKMAAGDDRREIRNKIGQKLVECLRRLGLHGPAQRETTRLVEVGAEDLGRGRVLATVDGEPITEADLDRMVEHRVDQLMAMTGASGNFQQRDAMLEQLSTPEMRQQTLEQLLQRRLLCRRARELKLDEEEEFRRARTAMTEDLLGQRLLARELAKIQPTRVDLEAFYKTHEDRYREQESIRVVTVALEDDEDPAAVLESIESADDFRKLAVKRQDPQPAEGQPAESRQLPRGQPDDILGDIEPLFDLEAGTWTTGPHVHEDRKFLVLAEEKTPARTPPLEEIAGRVESDYRTRKQQELSEHLGRDLMSRYEVKILPHEPTPNDDAPKEPSK